MVSIIGCPLHYTFLKICPLHQQIFLKNHYVLTINNVKNITKIFSWCNYQQSYFLSFTVKVNRPPNITNLIYFSSYTEIMQECID